MPKSRYVPASFQADAETLSVQQLMAKYNCSQSTVYRWKRVVKNKPDAVELSFDIDGYILGILWAVGYDTGDEFYVRHRDRDLLELLRATFRQNSRIITGTSSTDIQWRLKITGDARESILSTLSNHGWTPRNAEIREYPSGEIDHRGFIKAWIQLHSAIDYPKGRSRLRIYGNHHLIVTLNDIISSLTGVGLKTPQKLHNNKTYALYYQNPKEVQRIFNFFNLQTGKPPK